MQKEITYNYMLFSKNWGADKEILLRPRNFSIQIRLWLYCKIIHFSSTSRLLQYYNGHNPNRIPRTIPKPKTRKPICSIHS